MVNPVAKELLNNIRTMKALQKEIMDYCTGECHRCPIEKMCDWNYQIDLSCKYIEDYDLWFNFVKFAREHDEKEEA